MAAFDQGCAEPVTRTCGGRAPDDETREAAARVGTRLDERWSLVRLVAVGGTSAVYEAEGRRGERAAVKVLSRRWLPPESLLQQASYEAAVTGAVGHPGTVEMSSPVLTPDGTVYLRMELLEGETLEQRKHRAGGKLAPGAVLPIVDALLDIVAAAHDRAIVHHDIKPGNVFVTRSGQVKLMDFGLARQGSHSLAPTVWFGTPGFIGPEQARGQLSGADCRADVWALGATLFVALTGEAVHLAPTPVGEVELAATTPARSLREAAPGLPRHVVEAVDRALAFDADRRWSDVRDLRVALRGPEPVTVPPPREQGSGVHRLHGARWRRETHAWLEAVKKASAW